MAATESTMLALGTIAPEFALPDTVGGGTVRLGDLMGTDTKALFVMFICNHCPFVKHVRAELARIGKEYGARGVACVAISSNDVVNYPQDGPELMKREAREAGYPFPYLYDESQEVARAYRAACTPDFYIFDANKRLVYRGRLDGSRPGNGVPVTGEDVRAALDAVLAGKQPSENQRPSVGCGIKWK